MEHDAHQNLKTVDERAILRIFPSLAALTAGQVIGAICDCVPLKFGTVKVSYLFAPLMIPFAVPLYFWQKAFGPRYLLSDMRLRIQNGIVAKPAGEIALDEIGRVEIVVQWGQAFYHAGDLVIRDHLGHERLRLGGVNRPEIARRSILEARDSLVQTEAALRQIESRAALAG